MKVAIMQPYFLPYLGYLSLLKHVDRFILFDEVQFIRHGWIERNRILKPDCGWQYIQIPLVKVHRDTKIKHVQINNISNWKNKILAQLQHYKKKAPFYNETVSILNTIFEAEHFDIVELDKMALEIVSAYLGIHKSIEVYSQMNLQIDAANAPDEWALNICKALGNVDEYWNPPGGQLFFNKTKYDQANIQLKFHCINLSEYSQNRINFESGLSIIDVMMFNNVEKINNMLDKYEIQ